MEEKIGPLVGVAVGQAGGSKMQTSLLQAFQDPRPGGTENALSREEPTTRTTTALPSKAAEAVVDEVESSTGVAVAIGEPTLPVLRQLVLIVGEWVAEVAETIAHPLPVAITRNPRVMDLVAGMFKTGPRTTQPEPEIEVKPGVKAQSMKKSRREGGREVLKLVVRVGPATSVTQTRRKTPRNRTQKESPIMPIPQAVTFHLCHQEVHRQESSPPGVCPLGGAGVEVVEEEVATGVVAILEEQVGDTGLHPAQSLIVVPPSH